MPNNMTEGIKIVTTRENNYFLNNKIVFVEDVPTEGYYAMGDIAINMYPSEYFGWICTEDGEPGNWEALRSVTDDLMIPWTKVYQKPSTYAPTIGESSTTAFRGDYGKIAYDHSQDTHAPSNAQKNSDITKAEIEAKLTGTITSHTHSASDIGALPVLSAYSFGLSRTDSNTLSLVNDMGMSIGDTVKIYDVIYISPSSFSDLLDKASSNGIYYLLTTVSTSYGGSNYSLRGLYDIRKTTNSGWSLYGYNNLINMAVNSSKTITNLTSLPTFIANKAISSMPIPESGSYWKGFVKINTDGVAEVGKYIDFHNTNADTSDYNIRLQCNTTGQCTVTLPTSSGTLARTEDIDSAIGNINTILSDIVGS